MIRKIKRVKAFGSFSDFTWPAGDILKPFEKRNLFYGWNYSGKTTLSRMLRCFELGKVHEDFTAAEVQIELQDGSTVNFSGMPYAPILRVFNGDFVLDHLQFHMSAASPILVLGAEDIEKQDWLTKKRAEYDALVDTQAKERVALASCRTAYDNGLTDAARRIKNTLQRPSYDKRPFELKVAACKMSPDSYLLDDKTLAATISTCLGTDRRSEIGEISSPPTLLSAAKAAVEALLGRVVIASKPLPRLQADGKLERWVNDGRPLHEGKDTCQFCGQQLPPSLLAQMEAHFSAEYEGLVAELTTMSQQLETVIQEWPTVPKKGELYPELQERFAAAEEAFSGLKSERNEAISTLARSLAEKQTKAFSKMACSEIADIDAKIASAVGSQNEILRKHNNRTAAFDTEKAEAFAKLEMHAAAGFLCDMKETVERIESLSGTTAKRGQTMAAVIAEIDALETALSESSRGADRVNSILLAYFGRNDLQISVSTDKRFQIVRRGVLAKNLSEGEKTAIAFAYFISRVHDGKQPLAEIIAVVDDPISSLDGNHIFNTFALIKTHLADCRQLFVLTHNWEFYTLMKQWCDKDKKRDWRVLYTERKDEGVSIIRDIPKELLRFKSEYHYLFSKLHAFKETSGDFDYLLSLPNIVRRFLESFSGVMIPRSLTLQDKLKQLFPDALICERVDKFINAYSHSTGLTHALTVPDLSECRAVAEACLGAVKAWNEVYYNAMVEEVTDAPAPSASPKLPVTKLIDSNRAGGTAPSSETAKGA